MSIKVKELDTDKAKQELKQCPKIVRDYVKSLEYHLDIKQDIINKAIAKIRELSKI